MSVPQDRAVFRLHRRRFRQAEPADLRRIYGDRRAGRDFPGDIERDAGQRRNIRPCTRT
jgi:hypothetical protein